MKMKKRGRPSKADVALREAEKARIALANRPRPDAEVLADLTDRFKMLNILTQAATKSNIRALVVTGAPGVGKTYTVEQVLASADIRHDIVRGAMSAVNLYKLAYEYRQPGSVLVIDDADSIFNDEDALNILKVLCDSSVTRRVSWRKESAALREDDVPNQFDFNGAVIFISNLPFQDMVDEGRTKYAVHMEALMSRSLYLDLRLHGRQAIMVWVSHVARAGKMFVREGVSLELGERILKFINLHREDLRELSLRTVLKCCHLAKANPNEWEKFAKILLLRTA